MQLSPCLPLPAALRRLLLQSFCCCATSRLPCVCASPRQSCSLLCLLGAAWWCACCSQHCCTCARLPIVLSAAVLPAAPVPGGSVRFPRGCVSLRGCVSPAVLPTIAFGWPASVAAFPGLRAHHQLAMARQEAVAAQKHANAGQQGKGRHRRALAQLSNASTASARHRPGSPHPTFRQKATVLHSEERGGVE